MNTKLVPTTDMLRNELKTKEVVDVGKGVEKHLGISQHQLACAISTLVAEGYVVHYVKLNRKGSGELKNTTIKVLSRPGITYKDVRTEMESLL